MTDVDQETVGLCTSGTSRHPGRRFRRPVKGLRRRRGGVAVDG
ncbi:MAG: hypothetical protein ACRDGH_02700 [Candidatus Limnocylindria bacterium]